MRIIQSTLLRFLLLSVAACGGSNSEVDDPVFGPCYVAYDDPVLTITSATDSASGAPIAGLTIADITVDTVPLDLRTVVAPISNVQVVGNSVQCTLPCGFSTQEGTYFATMSAAGYKPATLSVVARYLTVTGSGCPAIYSGGKQTSVSLQPL